jgi:hypothetical protein
MGSRTQESWAWWALWALWMGEKAGVWSAASVKAAGNMSRIAAKKYVKILRLDGCSCKQGSYHPVWRFWQHRARLWTTEAGAIRASGAMAFHNTASLRYRQILDVHRMQLRSSHGWRMRERRRAVGARNSVFCRRLPASL